MQEILKLLVILAVLVVSNVGLGTFRNLKIENVKFDKYKFINGFLKGVIVGFGFFSLSFAMMQLPELSTELGVAPDVMILASIYIYGKKILVHLKDIFKEKESTGE